MIWKHDFRWVKLIGAVVIVFLSGCLAPDFSAPDSLDLTPYNSNNPNIQAEIEVSGQVDDQQTRDDLPEQTSLTYPIADTNQTVCYDISAVIACPEEGQAFYGQDAQYNGNLPQYVDNGDGTITDLVTGLMWQQDPGEKITYDEAVSGAASFSLAGYDDWRLPTIKELYSLIDFSGVDPSGINGDDTSGLTPFIDTDYFAFEYGDPASGERIIDSQFISSTEFVGPSGLGDLVFGVNFADGRIKGYPSTPMPGQQDGKLFFVLYVRGNLEYGQNELIDNGEGTVSDLATGLTWTQADSGYGMDWEGALAYCESLEVSGMDDWRLPNVKELQSIVDYTRSPATSSSAAIDPVFAISTIENEAGQADYPYFWSSTTHANHRTDSAAAYVAFGRALGYMNGWTDVHGAGAQRSDPKTGDPESYPTGHGPQGDAIRIENYVRCVRDGSVVAGTGVEGANEASPSVEAVQGGDGPGGGQTPDLAAAAEKLGISEQALRDALGPPPPDLQAAAATLRISVALLEEALGLPPGGGPNP